MKKTGMKKLITALTANAILLAVTIFTVLPMSVQAAGGRGRADIMEYPVCAIEDCTLTGWHNHDGQTYAAHYYGDGHDYHGYCEVEGCTAAGYHGHDGAYCFARTGDGYYSNSGDGYYGNSGGAYCGGYGGYGGGQASRGRGCCR